MTHKKVIGITVIGITISLVTIKMILAIIGYTLFDTVLRWISPLGLEMTSKELSHIFFASIITAFISYFVWTGKIKIEKYIPDINKILKRFK